MPSAGERRLAALLSTGLVAGCFAANELGGLPAEARSVLVVERSSELRVGAFSAEEAHFSGGAEAWALAYPFTLEELGLDPGPLSSGAADACGGRGFGAPLVALHLDGRELETVDLSAVPLGTFRLPPLDALSCIARTGCLELGDGLALCRETCAEAVPAPPLPPSPPVLPSFCAARGCPSESDTCPGAEVRLPGSSTCVALAPCGPGPFRMGVDASAIGAEPRYVDASAPGPGDGSAGAPYPSLELAFTPGVTSIFLAPGLYVYTSTRTLGRIYGLCPEQTRLQLPLGMRVASPAHVEGLTIEPVGTGPLRWLEVSSALAFVEAHLDARTATAAAALGVGTGAVVTFDRAKLDAGAELAVVGPGGRLELRHASVRTGGLGNPSIGGQSADLLLEDTWFEGGDAREQGFGNISLSGGSLTMRSVHFEPGGQIGIKLRTDARLDAEDVDFDGRPQSTCDGTVEARASEVHLTRALLRDACRGLNVAEGRLVIADLTVTDTGVDERGSRIFAVEANESDVEIDRLSSSGQGPLLATTGGSLRAADLDGSIDGEPTLTVVSVLGSSLDLRRLRILPAPNGTLSRVGVLFASGNGPARIDDLEVVVQARALEIDQNDSVTELAGARLQLRAEQIGLLASAQDVQLEDLAIEAEGDGVVAALSENVRLLRLRRFSIAASVPWSVTRAGNGVVDLEGGRLLGRLPEQSELSCWPNWNWRWRDVLWSTGR